MPDASDVAVWGSVADWVSGVGTAGALLFAFAGWRIAKQEQHAAGVEKREQDARDRAAHARQFTCWAGGGSSTTADDGRMRYGVSVYVLNNSDHTFLNVDVTATATGPTGWQEVGSTHWARVLPNPNAVEVHQEAAVLHPDTGERPLVLPRWSVEASFTDVNGVRWRYADGQLQTLRESAGIPASSGQARPRWRRMLHLR